MMTARITIDGNLVADPDFGVGNSGTSWAHMRIASHERIRRDGEWVSTDPEFFNITVFGEAAEAAANELHKGDRVDLTGRVQLETFDRRDGTTGAAIKVYARAVSKHEDRPSNAAGGPAWGLNDDPVVRINNPDDPMGPPAYEGAVSKAHGVLAPGVYAAASYGDGSTTFETGADAPITVNVGVGESHIDRVDHSPAPIADRAPQLRIHHTAEGTSVVGVDRAAAALHKTLKDNGFRWSTPTTSWNLPKDMDEHTRATRVSELLSAVRAHGRDIPVSYESAPLPAPRTRSAANAGAAPAAVTELRPHAGRSL